MSACWYHQDYGGGRVRGAACSRRAIFRLVQVHIGERDHVVDVCHVHARAIVGRYPTLGGGERFARIARGAA